MEDDEEDIAVALYVYYQRFMCSELLVPNPRLDFSNLPMPAREMFRFELRDFFHLADLLRLPETIRTRSRHVVGHYEALAITLRRFAYPNRLSDLCPIFGRSKAALSEIHHHVVKHIFDNFAGRLAALDRVDYAACAAAVAAKGAPFDFVFGFIDGTTRDICRPVKFQESVYSGHHRTHCLKFQVVMLPNGIIAHLFGPLEGRWHDITLLRRSGLLDVLEGLQFAREQWWAIYGDKAYVKRPFLLSPFQGTVLTPAELQLNTTMSRLRLCVEWGFGKIASIWAFLDFEKNLKLLKQPLAQFYSVGAILTNCHTCLYGGVTSTYYDMLPPTLDEYLT
eukprot:gnl/Spiro4/17685_TR9416_c0_g1_i1.p1 gnl/Spiro4/17685_TR9416_c0_g1~~gnl/Spiro4/17685_TR9416_c0_g1_i1.p1  ORF type:complete len:345 (-),score=71.32 gnl/Spiro4/17685_TR9416_c0_g1_i1:44-1051(-)